MFGTKSLGCLFELEVVPYCYPRRIAFVYTDESMKESAIIGIHHVQLAMPAGGEEK